VLQELAIGIAAINIMGIAAIPIQKMITCRCIKGALFRSPKQEVTARSAARRVSLLTHR
jgi:hypothetical protein